LQRDGVRLVTPALLRSSGAQARVRPVVGFLPATQPARTIVVERGGTAWWVPFLTALLVALAAAAASYYATWRFKRADVDRENALRAVDLVDRAEQIASLDPLWRDEGEGGLTTHRLLQEARVRTEPLDDDDLDKRFRAALSYNTDLLGWKDTTSAARHWLAEASADVREALVPHLKAPKFIPRKRVALREFPTLDELNAMPADPSGRDGQRRIDALVDWKAKQ
jgi:hypothetical protein